jgi:endonuclease/exonuclease/phosphatase family metal-dependent hydrolase
MPLKIIQLNCWGFKYFEEIRAFLIAEQPDIINLQEVTTRRYLDEAGDYIDELKRTLKMDGVFVPWKTTQFDDGSTISMGNATLTRLEMVDYGYLFDRYLPKMKPETEAEYNRVIELCKINKNLAYPLVFQESKNFIWSLLRYNGKLIRNITSHFSVSQRCTEILQMIQQGDQVIELYDQMAKYPTLFSGDLNIHQDSGVVQKLSTVFDIVNKGSINSLNKAIHPVFAYEKISDLKVDYIMQNGFKVIETHTPEITVSDHLPVIATLEIN